MKKRCWPDCSAKQYKRFKNNFKITRMRQVLYINADEEMISVIGRVRKSPSVENVIVAPQRAFILQSIVNLRLLAHDARKNGKEIILVTQDEQSRSLCEKAGIQTRKELDENDDDFNSTIPMTHTLSQENTYREEADHSSMALPRSDMIGSDDFFARNDTKGITPMFSEEAFTSSRITQSLETPLPPSSDGVRKVTVRNREPHRGPSLNSMRVAEEQSVLQQKSFTPPSLRGSLPVRPVFGPVSHSSPAPAPRAFPAASAPKQKEDRPTHPVWFRSEAVPVSTPPEKPVIVSKSGNLGWFMTLFGFISVISLMGVGAYIFLPKATLTVTLKSSTQKSDFDFDGSITTLASSAESRMIPVRVIEKDQDITVSFDTTGKSSLSDQKARGSITIYNRYSSEPQLLIASTRFASEDGHIFRLLSSVTVPGMTGSGSSSEPGAIEAVVVADHSGSEYNISPSSFTIPGFSGSAKYGKFTAISSSAMNGGGASGSDTRAVSEEDVTKAKQSVEASLKETVMQSVQSTLNDGEKIMENAIQSSILNASVSPQIGVPTDSFEYRVKVHIKALVFSESDLQSMITDIFTKQNADKGLVLTPDRIDLQYGESTVNFDSGTIRIKVHAIGTIASSVDEASLKNDVLGKSESDLPGILQKYTQIKTISVLLWPDLITSKIPTRADRVMIIVESH